MDDERGRRFYLSEEVEVTEGGNEEYEMG